MPKSKIGPAIRDEDYQTFREICSDLPETFGEWTKNAADIDRRLRARGIVVDRIVIKPDEFAAWTRERGLSRDELARRAFAITKERRK
jgi:hypothetical protein